jgi:metal transporter CNNM
MAKPVLVMMWLTAIVSWPIAKLLDWLLGEDHGTVYKKSGLKTLVTLHKSLGDVSQRLNQDEVTIISAVLDLKAKPVESVMTPMSDVFTMSEDTVLDEATMDLILSAGYSRIPIHEPGSPTNFVGMLLVKILITYDPEDAKLVSEFPLATLPETRPETSCLDIVNFFQEGKSHMVLVSEYPGEDHGALGVVTLEDVIEELIGEEIIDESDVYIDVHKAIRRLTPAPKARLHRVNSGTQAVAKPTYTEHDVESADAAESNPRARRPGSVSALSEAQVQVLSSSPHPDNPRAATLMMRRSSAGIDGQMSHTTVPVRTNFEEMKQHLRHLGPSNPATNPKGTKSTTVKIKPGHSHPISSRVGSIGEVYVAPPREDDETTSLLNKVNGKDGVQALQVEHYGSTGQSPTRRISQPKNGSASTEPGADDLKDEGTQTVIVQPDVAVEVSPISEPSHASSSESLTAQTPKRTYVRSGSITESVIETRGVRKVILATTGSNEDEEGLLVSRSPTAETSPTSRTASRSALSFFGTSAKDRLEEENEEETEEEEGLLKAETEVSGNEGSDANGVGGSMDGGASSSTSTTRPKETKAPARKKPNRRRKRKGGRS